VIPGTALVAALLAAGAVPTVKPAPFSANEGSIRAPLPFEYVPLAVDPAFDVASVPLPDRALAAGLAARVTAGAVLGEDDIRAGERLSTRQRGVPATWRLLRAVYVRAAEQARARHDVPAALEHLRRLTAVAPEPAVDVDILVLLLEGGSWREAEAAARSFANAHDEDARGALALAYALLRDDRASEALEALEAAPQAAASPAGKTLLARVRRALGSEAGMHEARQWHFHVLYEGAANPDLARALTERLESHYAMLAGLFECQPAATIPVVLFTKEHYYSAGVGGPRWSEGVFDVADGRIRVPVGGLTAGALSTIDGTLLHELVHVFVVDRTAGTAPRLLHEGLAQYVTGDRVAALLDASQLAALADGRARGVGGFYVEALAFAEYLMDLGGPRGIADLLAALGEAGDIDAGFRKVYGRGYVEVQADWRAWMQARYR
jgi:hypothetical protein